MSRGQDVGVVGDVGATNARFALVEKADGHRRLMAQIQLACADFPSFEAVLAAYLRQVGAAPRRGVIAVAGAVKNNSVHFTNLDWFVTDQSLAKAGLPALTLINDFAAQALALPFLDDSRLCPLGPLTRASEGMLAVIGPGSGLGIAGLLRRNGQTIPLATEGGHADFAPTDEIEIELLRDLQRRHGRVSIEMLLSGAGLTRIHRFLAGESAPDLAASEISARGLAGDEACHATLLRFCDILGSVAGNVALSLGATGGLFIAGGIAPRLLPLLRQSRFRQRFEAKGPMSDYVRAIPSLVITDTQSALLGAASLIGEEQ
jgi:glucokinase